MQDTYKFFHLLNEVIKIQCTKNLRRLTFCGMMVRFVYIYFELQVTSNSEC